MYHDIAKVDQDPSIRGITLDPPGKDAVLLFGLFRDMLNNGFQLPVAGSAQDDEEIRYRRHLTHIHENNVFSFLVRCQVDDDPGKLYRFQWAFLQSGEVTQSAC